MYMKQFRTFLSLLLALTVLCVSGCDISTIENAFGLGMNSPTEKSENTEKTSVEIEYFDSDAGTNDQSSDLKSDETDSVSVPKEDETVVEVKDDELIYDDVNKLYSVNCTDPDRITISFAGDVCLTEGCSVLNYIKLYTKFIL